MKRFGDGITLSRNSRGCYILDTVKGCSVVNHRQGGCYGECYAHNIANRYRFDFGSPIDRVFRDDKHKDSILAQIRSAKMPFIRIGEMGDPSENWRHTVEVISSVRDAGKDIVLITKHWKTIPEDLLEKLYGVCVNTSVSAMDSQGEINYRLEQYRRLRPYCNSVLRVVSCKFNLRNATGARMAKIQDELFSEGAIDTVFRPSPNNPLLRSGIILTEKRKFLGTEMLSSVYDENAYFGKCDKCPDMCGIIKPEPKCIPQRDPIKLNWPIMKEFSRTESFDVLFG